MTHRWSLRTRFVLFAMACLLPLVLVAWFFLDRSTQRSTDQIINNEQTVLDIVNRSLTSYLSNTETALTSLGQQVPIEEAILDFDPERSNELLGQARLVNRDLNGLFVVTDNLVEVSQAGTQLPTGMLQSIEIQLRETIQQGDPTISGVLTLDDGSRVLILAVPVTTGVDTASSRESGETPATLDQLGLNSQFAQTEQTGTTEDPVTSPGENIGAIGAIIPAANLEQRVLPFSSGRTEIAVTDGINVLIGTTGIVAEADDFLIRQTDIITSALGGTSDNLTIEDANGVERVVVYGPVQNPKISWAIFISSPTARTYTSSLYMQGLIVLSLAGTIILALAVVFGELTARPVRTLARKADSLQRGDFSTDLQPMGGGEIRVLSQAFSDMARQLKAQFMGLEESRHERERQTAQMRDLLRRTLRLQEDERRRIAGEIHDAVSPLITGALYQARALLMTNGKTPPEEREQTLSNVNTLLERASDELHGVIFDLRPPDLDDLGVVAAIEAYVQTIKQTGLECRLEVENEPSDLSPEVRLGIYRIVQEALHNVVRHSGADEAVVRLETIGERLRVTIRDNGSGFDPEKAVRPTSLGLLSMKERADAIGATFQIVSRAGGGTAIIIDRTNSGNVMSDDVLATLIQELETDLGATAAGVSGGNEESTGKNAS
ncbi:MAG: ATP-binding protein [Thermomicrobiales bacterium]